MKMKTFRIGFVMVLVWTIFALCLPMVNADAKSPVLDRILKRGELVVGVSGNQPPLNMRTKSGTIIGLEADLAQMMADAMGVRLKLFPMNFNMLIPTLEDKGIDMIMSGMTMTPKRNLDLVFVGPYFLSGKSFLTKSQTIASLKDAAEIDSPRSTVAALDGSTSQLFVEAIMPRAKLIKTKTYDAAVKMVLEGRVDAFIADYPICIISVFRYPDQGLVSLITPLTYEPVGIGMPANDPHLVNWIENFLNTLEGSGQLEELRAHWFEDASWLTDLP
jgi:polar amino acid transport system substrate-binding protein